MLLLLLACRQENKTPYSEVPLDTAGPIYGDEDGDSYTISEGDCNDEDATINPEAFEICDGIDNNCNNEIDENLDKTWYQDSDGDGYGDDSTAITTCQEQAGYVEQGGDCNDSDAAFHPDAEELDCTDPNDYNCDGIVGYEDADGDGVAACEDCNDARADIYPGAQEVCDPDNIDEDCNGLADDEDPSVDPNTFKNTWTDSDGDGFGDDATGISNCDGFGATQGGDCNDTDPAFYPGAPETDCTDPNDYNCDGTVGYQDGDGDGFVACEECNDADATINPDAIEVCDSIDNNCDGSIDEDVTSLFYADSDGDGFGNPLVGQYACSAPAGFVGDASDCDDQEAAINPAGIEICDGLDNDCDGTVDIGAVDGASWYQDTDGDGFGDPLSVVLACSAGAGVVQDNTDCNDADNSIYPGATELCDGLDNDCNGSIDDNAVDAGLWYQDLDGDGYGDDSTAVLACSGAVFVGGDCNDADAAYNPGAPEPDCLDPNDYNCDGSTGNQDADGDGFGACEECNDGDSAINPAAAELCDGIDNNCDGSVDGNDASNPGIWYADADADGFGDASLSVSACTAPSGYIADNSDCDDLRADVSPANLEICDGLDNDCDGSIDNNAVDAGLWLVDSDGDGYGDSSTVLYACEQPSGYTGIPGDCNDADASYNPAALEEDCTDPNDYNCDGAVGYADNDGDGYIACEECDDADANTHPSALEICDSKDNNCNGVVDEPGAANEMQWYLDSDGDGYGDSSVAFGACTQPSGYVADNSDCDDSNSLVHPGGAEVCDGLDNDCDGSIDNNAIDGSWWYLDADGDNYGDGAMGRFACEGAADEVADSSDCDDLESSVHPDALEICDGLDNNCDGSVDNNAVDEQSWYLDVDGDGFGDDAVVVVACDAPSGYVNVKGDCNDSDSLFYPGAPENCSDSVDYNCDGSFGSVDGDGDGFTACEECDDADAAVNPAVLESCNGVDDNCDGTIDEAGALGESVWYLDLDGDGYGDASSLVSACDAPAAYVSNSSDCDDLSYSVNPAALESCNGVDDDCDGSVDEAGASGESVWYLDADNDGYGDASSSVMACDAPSGYSALSSDCDDNNASISPGAPDICDTLDNDCDGSIDEGGYCSCPVVTYQNKAYMFCPTTTKWATAYTNCLSAGYELLSINDSTENSWIVSTARSYVAGNWWTGGNDLAIEGNWQWISGDSWSYSNWGAGQGYSSSKDCMMAGKSAAGTWEDESCTKKKPYICEAP